MKHLRTAVVAVIALLVLATAALAATPRPGRFIGNESGCIGSCPQVRLYVAKGGKKLRADVANWEADCQSVASGFLGQAGAHNAYDSGTRGTAGVRVRGGRFSDRGAYDEPAQYAGPGKRAHVASTLTGRFLSATRARVTFHVVVTLTDASGRQVDRCTGTEHFNSVPRK